MGYGWGDDTSVSRSSGGGGYDFTSARRAYVDPPSSPPRTYSRGSSGGGRKKSVPSARASSPRTYRSSFVSTPRVDYPLNLELETDSESPIVVAIDVTGSMSTWPGIFFEKLPLLYKEAKLYLPDTEISFAAVGDAFSDRYPIQVAQFAKGKSLDTKLDSLYPEGGGGGGARESYELMAYYYANHVKMPKAKNPLFFFLGDEGYYTTVDKGQVERFIGDGLEADVKSKDVFGALRSRFNVYAIRKNYDYGDDNTRIQRQWRDTLGAENVVMLEDPRRVVDNMIGLIAGYAGKFETFSRRLIERQTDDQVSEVMKSLHHVSKRALGKAAVSLKKLPDGRKAKKLN